MENNNVKTLQKVYSLKEAYESIPKKQIVTVREALRVIVGTKDVQNVYLFINGRQEPKIIQAIAMNLLFADYGIEIQWGKTPPVSD
jgi:hypothetical protein